ncbi:MAG: hypothetical protein GY711_07150 [bacterium]|nr:hypothetical protein [bacterium]
MSQPFTTSVPTSNGAQELDQRARSASPAPRIQLDRAALDDLGSALETEWLEPDGRGGFAASTVHLCPTRRYHGLLAARIAGHADPHLFLARLVEEVEVAGGAGGVLAMARYAGELVPPRNELLERFELAPHPRWTFAGGGLRLTREVQMARGLRTVLVRYTNDGDAPLRLALRPLCPFRRVHDLTVANDALDTDVERIEGGLRVRPYAALPELAITLGTAFDFDADPTWFRDLRYAADERRGFDGGEDQWSPGTLRVALEPGASVVLAATVEVDACADPTAVWERTRAARAGWLPAGEPTATERLAIAAGDFLYRTDEGRLGILAGFPWFGEWGRDTFIALPGLTLGRGQVEACAEVLEGALAFLKGGLLPNVFGRDVASSHYGSADAALWFARAVRLYELALGSREAVRTRFLEPLASIAEAYERGTTLGMEVDDRGLLRAGSGVLNATWMDAVTSAGPVTPRAGCAVELNGLWIFLLRYLEELTGGDPVWARRRTRAEASFRACFWLADERRLADVWDADAPDRRVRPNMVIAAALEFSPLSTAERAGVVACARAELLTPRGLRTLSPSDSEYVPRYAGGPEERDGAYHQGTVWPWLLGFYTEAALRAGASRAERRELQGLWSGLAAELDVQGLDHVSEVFDGDAPHTGGGTFAQAWNTAEMLRALALLES